MLGSIQYKGKPCSPHDKTHHGVCSQEVVLAAAAGRTGFSKSHWRLHKQKVSAMNPLQCMTQLIPLYPPNTQDQISTGKWSNFPKFTLAGWAQAQYSSLNTWLHTSQTSWMATFILEDKNCQMHAFGGCGWSKLTVYVANAQVAADGSRRLSIFEC